jgi:hypothetical protein
MVSGVPEMMNPLGFAFSGVPEMMNPTGFMFSGVPETRFTVDSRFPEFRK